MTSERYHKLFGELNARHLTSREAEALVAELGAPAMAFRAFTFTRHHSWGSARRDLRAALDAETGRSPLVDWLCGVGLFIAHDYERGLAAIVRAAEAASSEGFDLRLRARKLGIRLCTLLGWYAEARELRERIAGEDIRGRKHLQAHTLELRRQAAIRRRAQDARAGTPAEAARKSYALVLRDGVEAARSALTQLRAGGALEPLRQAVRLELLAGEIDAAALLLAGADASLEVELRGEFAALALAQGDLDALELATRAARKGPEADPRLLYLRGRLAHAKGRRREAAGLLEQARGRVPNNVAIVMALALVRHELEPESCDEGLAHRFDELLHSAPALLSDAAASLGIELWGDLGSTREREEQAAIIRGAQALLTAEHDLALTSYARRGPEGELRLRHVGAIARDPSHLDKLEAEHAELISRHEAILVWDIGVTPRPSRKRSVRADAPAQLQEQDATVSTGAGEPWTPRELSPAQIEQFLRDGFVTVPNALDGEFAARVRADATRRIREEPELWIRGYDANERSRSLASFQPDDPSTWTWPRIELSGPELWKIEDIAPRAWFAICDLLGGPRRVETTSWGNYLLLALRQHGNMARAQPGPNSEGWHIDDPGPSTRISNMRNGLVCIALFDDLQPESGNTWLAPDSVGRVARELAAHPGGVDFISNRGAWITARCRRFHEVTGRTGDVLLLHPLLMHSASNNKSTRVRWMANPMIYLKQPLDPFRDVGSMSPVERAIHLAISK